MISSLRSDGTAAGTAFVDAEERAIIGEQTWWEGAGASGSGIAVTQRSALRHSAFLAGVTVLSTDIAALPRRVHRIAKDKSREEQTGHPVHEIMNRTPDGERTPINWIRSWVAHAIEIGSGYAEIERTGRGSPAALHLLDPETTRAQRLEGMLGYRLGNGKWLPAANVLHISGLGWDGLTGYNPLHLLCETLGLSLASQGFAADYFNNGSEPGGVIETPHRLGSEAYNRLRDSFSGRHQGPGKRHKTAILEQGAKWNSISTDPEKAQLLDTRKFQVIDAIRSLRVPPNKVGDYSQAHLSNLDAANTDYLQTALLGWLETIEQECSLKLFTRAEWLAGFRVDHDVDAFLRGDSTSRWANYTAGIDRGVYSRNEVRAREGLNPIPADKGGDLYTVQSQNVPLDQTGSGTKPDDKAKPETPSPTAEPATPAEAPVANTALNGAQVTSLLEIANAVAAGTLPSDTAKGLILASFPGLTDAQVAAILTPLEGFVPPTPEPASNPTPPTPEEPAADDQTPTDA